MNIDPETAWRIIDGKLYLGYDPSYVAELDGPEPSELLAKAEANWPRSRRSWSRSPCSTELRPNWLRRWRRRYLTG